ncbi:MAG: hypothetical protein LBV72_10210 [Tannerella sp.]|jgi:hypothetical protein|nr:hypothetical protein [Tannerella sp.]
MKIKERFYEYLKYLDKGQTAYELKAGLSRGQLSKKTGFSSDSLEKITICSPELNIEWLITGYGNMLKKPENVSISKNADYRLVPLWNLDGVGGMNKNNEIALDDPQYIIRMIPFTDAQKGDKCFPVSSDSMSPTCPSGSIVLARKVESWNEYFGYGNIFYLMLKDGRRILKEVQKFDENSKDYVLCVSHKPGVPAEELPRNLIGEVWKVIKILTDRGW